MANVKEALRQLDLGKSVAEFDSALEKYFVETDTFRALIEGRADIVAGDKGTGKTAIYRILQKRYASIDVLKKTEVLAAFNPSGSPIFQRLVERETLEEAEYIRLWKAYVLALAGNWLLLVYDGSYTTSMEELDKLLRGLDLRDKAADPPSTWARVMSHIGKLFRWKSASVQITATDNGMPVFTPKIEFDPNAPDSTEEVSVSISSALRVLDTCIAEADLSMWIAFDRLDEAFQGYQQVEVPALRALFRTYLDLLEFESLRLKLFVRRDLFGRVTAGGFVNLTHVNARKIEIVWDEEDLLNLLARRIRENRGFCAAVGISESTDKEVFDKLFPNQVDFGKRKPQTWTWIMRRIRDGNDIKPPRNLIDLISLAQQAQLRREDRDARELKADQPIIESDNLRRALSQLSVQRVQDTLIAEAGINSPLVERFRGGKAEHNIRSLSEIFGVPENQVLSSVKPLLEIGFLEEIKGSYKIPSLYRDGLSVTQGKAFEVEGLPSETDDSDE